jgi:hypothetical protein
MVEAQRETEMEEHDKMINAKRQAKEAAATIEKLNREASKIIRQIERDGNVEMVPYRQARFFGQLEAANRAFGPRPGFMFNLMRRRKRPTKRRRRRRDDDNDRNTDSDSSDSDKDDEKKDDDDEDANNQNKYVRGRVAASGQQVNYSNSAAKRSKRRTGKTREKSQSVDNADVYFGSRQRQTRQLSDNLYDAGADYEHRLPTDGRLRWLQHQLSPELVYPSLNRPVYGGGYGTVSPYGYWMMGGLAGTAPAIAATATEAAAVRIKGFGDTALRKKVRVTKSSGSSPVGT